MIIYKSEKSKNVTETVNLDHLPRIQGYDFEKRFDFKRFVESYATSGFQATNLARAITITNQMIKDATIFLAFTSNMVSSGMRDIITYLVKNKKVHFLVTTAGGIEEDLIKCMKPFHLGKFGAPGEVLFRKGVNRTGNIFIPNDRYLEFERFMTPFLEKVYKEQNQIGRPLSTSEIIKMAGLEIDNKSSFLYWAAKNDIPVICPALTDGAFGDMMYFAKKRHPDFAVDITRDMNQIVDRCMNIEKSGAIILGGGVAKHYVLNANIFREGLDYVVYINTAQEFDGSDSGAKIDEAVTWGKIKPDAKAVKVHADATLVFPLLVAAAFK